MPGGDDDEMVEINPDHWREALDLAAWELERKANDDD